MAFCAACGLELRDSANFCPKCGTPSRWTPESSEAESTVIEYSFNKTAMTLIEEVGDSWAKEILHQRKFAEEFLNDESLGMIFPAFSPPNESGESGHYGNSWFNCIFSRKFIALYSENGGPLLNGKLGFKKSTGNPWALIFPVDQFSSLKLLRGVWQISDSRGEQQADFWYLVLDQKAKIAPLLDADWWPLDLTMYPDRKTFKYGWNSEKTGCPRALYLSSQRAIRPEQGDFVWHIGLTFEETGDPNIREKHARGLVSSIEHYPNFSFSPNESIVSRSVFVPENRPGGFSFGVTWTD